MFQVVNDHVKKNLISLQFISKLFILFVLHFPFVFEVMLDLFVDFDRSLEVLVAKIRNFQNFIYSYCKILENWPVKVWIIIFLFLSFWILKKIVISFWYSERATFSFFRSF